MKNSRRLKIYVHFPVYISPIRLPTHAEQGNSFSGGRLRASGWGKISDSEYIILLSNNLK
jgi:hypothetical protein